jgi:Phosphatase-1 catalytic subunit binding region
MSSCYHHQNSKKTKVKFLLKPVIIIIDNEEDRKGQWEIYARDRERFNRRVQDIENKIGWCFHRSHREKIYTRDIQVVLV